ncbi:hypothetical protein EIP91_004877 [Steccherinum ochraceum]|uniref:F-box domain-containing protein n=1 Tax=Steccherinum ochraceum TaxID=92696 RepID=A0A4R0RB35_9APHY|nr:hypothetical protein EIP91_004877 [Steccherinum ochraceum]
MSLERRHDATRQPSPLARLQPELLSMVFLELREPVMHEEDSLYCVKSLHFTHACHYWREVAMRTQALWRIVMASLPKDADFASAMVSRSGTAPLTLVLFSDDITSALEFLPLVLHRVEYLSLKQWNWTISDALRMSALGLHTAIAGLKPTMAPLLKHLETQNFGGRVEIAPDLDDRYLLHIARASLFDSDGQFLSHLSLATMKHLELDQLNDPIAAEEFIQVLQNMPCLENLSVFISFEEDATFTDNISRPIKLPYLRCIELRDDSSSCAYVLDHLLFPTSTKITLEHDLTERYATSATAALMAKVAGNGIIGDPQPTHTLHIFPIMSDSYHLPTALFWAGDSNCSSLPDGQYKLFSDERACPTLGRILNAAPRSLPYLKSLRVSDPPSFSTWFIRRHYYWLGNLRILEGLEEIELDGLIFTGLGVLDPVTGDPIEPPFPRLRLLTLRNIIFSTPTKSLLSSMLDGRKDAGMQLQTLKIVDARQITQVEVDMFREYVQEVDWDGRDLDPGRRFKEFGAVDLATRVSYEVGLYVESWRPGQFESPYDLGDW